MYAARAFRAMPSMPSTPSIRRSLSALLLPVVLSGVTALSTGACSKKGTDEGDAGEDGGADAGLTRDAADEADAPPDARTLAEQAERAGWEDAGRACGAKTLPDCPMQAWMKRHATTMVGFGDISALAQVFEQIATMAPDDALPDGGPIYVNWRSISMDGAAAARAGDVSAAKGACRGCHVQYRSKYHTELRGKPVAQP
jgi:hypothetical protein